jgi:hypothetical protein
MKTIDLFFLSITHFPKNHCVVQSIMGCLKNLGSRQKRMEIYKKSNFYKKKISKNPKRLTGKTTSNNNTIIYKLIWNNCIQEIL